MCIRDRDVTASPDGDDAGLVLTMMPSRSAQDDTTSAEVNLSLIHISEPTRPY